MFIYANGYVYMHKGDAKPIVAITTYSYDITSIEVIDAYWINTGKKYRYLTYFDHTEINYYTKVSFVKFNKKKESYLIIISGVLL